jgi:hypothetical protein
MEDVWIDNYIKDVLENSIRECEVCRYTFNKKDIIVKSSFSAATYGYCCLCNSLGAEPAGMEELIGKYLTFKNGTYTPIQKSYEYINTFIKTLDESVIPDTCSKEFRGLLIKYKEDRLKVSTKENVK